MARSISRRVGGLLHVLQMLTPVLPPGVDLSFVGVNACLLLMEMPVDWQAFPFPAPHCAFAAFEIAGNLLPRIEAIADRGAGRLLPYIGHMVSHKDGPEAGYLFHGDSTAAILALQCCYRVLREAVNVVIGELAVFASCGSGCQVLGWPNGAEARARSKSWR